MDLKLIENYLEGKASPEGKKQILEFFKEKELNPANEEELRTMWEQYFPDNKIIGSQELILKRIYEQKGIRAPMKSTQYLRWISIAASLVLMATVSFFIYQYAQSNTEQGPIAEEIITKHAPVGVKLKFELPDGSMVNLNSNSSLSYPSEFGTDSRSVTLQGEAYFDVAKNMDWQFIVNCNGIITTVLGTSFNIFAHEEEVVVSVTSGKVKVDFDQSDSQSIYLTPGEQVKWNTFDHIASVQQFNLYKTIAWRDGIIIFDESGLSEIINILHSWYGVDIDISGKNDIDKVKWRYSGEFDNESLDNVLNGIAYVKGFDYKISGKKVMLYL